MPRRLALDPGGGALCQAGLGSGIAVGHGLLAAVDALEDTSGKGQEKVAGPRRIVIVSDLQEGAKLDGLQGFDWPRGIEVSIETVKTKRPTNAGVQVLLDQDDTPKSAGENEIKIRVANGNGTLKPVKIDMNFGSMKVMKKMMITTPTQATTQG